MVLSVKGNFFERSDKVSVPRLARSGLSPFPMETLPTRVVSCQSYSVVFFGRFVTVEFIL